VTLPHVTVISTGWSAPTAGVCRASVASQLGVDVDHIYIEASDQSPPRTKMQNLRAAIATLPPDRVVALVDGDDWLAHRRALARIAEAHASGMWVTFGSFADTSGQRGFAEPYRPDEDYRSTHWRATHLKTFRAGLFQRLREDDLQMPCPACWSKGLRYCEEMRWIDRADDPAFMYPILEQAGRDRVRFIPDVLYVYAASQAWEKTASAEQLQHEKRVMGLTRARPAYKRIDNL
jgi:hypothetical protein